MKEFTFQEFLTKFPDDAVCLDWLFTHRWPEGVYCQSCQRITKHHRLRGRTCYSCDYCGRQVYPLVGTILEHSPTSLTKWFYTMFLMASTRCGISAKQIERETGVTYKTAWRMCKQIRTMLTGDTSKLFGDIEVDESYFGGRRRGKRGRGATNKTIVAGAVKRKGQVIASVVPNVKSATLLPFVTKHIMPSSVVYTDELPSYNQLGRQGYEHRRIQHQSQVYVSGNVHTNTIEGFWSLVKRGIGGVYHSVSQKYLQNYLDEYSFRYNHRGDDTAMFAHFLNRLAVPASSAPSGLASFPVSGVLPFSGTPQIGLQ